MLAFMAMLGLIAVVFVIAYFSLHRERPIVDIHEVAEHPEVPVGQ